MMGYYNTYGWNSWMLIVMLAWPVILAGAIWAMVLVTRDRPDARRETAGEAPLEVLKRRFARGDITEQEYLESRAILKNDGSREVQRS